MAGERAGESMIMKTKVKISQERATESATANHIHPAAAAAAATTEK